MNLGHSKEALRRFGPEHSGLLIPKTENGWVLFIQRDRGTPWSAPRPQDGPRPHDQRVTPDGCERFRPGGRGGAPARLRTAGERTGERKRGRTLEALTRCAALTMDRMLGARDRPQRRKAWRISAENHNVISITYVFAVLFGAGAPVIIHLRTHILGWLRDPILSPCHLGHGEAISKTRSPAVETPN